MLARGHAPLQAWAVGAILTANGPFTVKPGELNRMHGISPGASKTVADGIRSVCGSRVSPYDQPRQIAARITETDGDSVGADPRRTGEEREMSWPARLSDHKITVPNGVDRWLTPPTPPEQLAVALPPHPRPGITDAEVLVLTALRSYLSGADSAVLAAAVEISRRSAQRALRSLEADGYVASAFVEVPWKHRVRRILRWKLNQGGPFNDLRPYMPMMRRHRRAPCPETLPPDLWHLFWSGPDPADIRLPRDAPLVANRLLNGRLLDFDARRWALRCLPLDALIAQTGIPGCPESVELAVAELVDAESDRPNQQQAESGLSTHEVHTLVDGVSVHVFEDPNADSRTADVEVLQQGPTIDGMPVTSLPDLLALKLDLIRWRSTLRDLIDLAAIDQLSGHRLEDGLSYWLQKFSAEWDNAALDQLVFRLRFPSAQDADPLFDHSRDQVVAYLKNRAPQVEQALHQRRTAAH